jgi:hypothetical protein
MIKPVLRCTFAAARAMRSWISAIFSAIDIGGIIENQPTTETRRHGEEQEGAKNLLRINADFRG